VHFNPYPHVMSVEEPQRVSQIMTMNTSHRQACGRARWQRLFLRLQREGGMISHKSICLYILRNDSHLVLELTALCRCRLEQNEFAVDKE
jgi:hypothetical protein